MFGSSCKDAGSPNRCMLATFGTDGAGRRFEAAFSCIASAQALDMQYVHMPLVAVQHLGLGGPAAANDHFGLGGVPCWPHANVTATRAHCGNCLPEAVQPAKYTLSRIPYGDAGSCAYPAGSRLDEFERSPATCLRDGRTVYTAYHCFDFFWCHVVRAREGRPWFEVPIGATVPVHWLDFVKQPLDWLAPLSGRGRRRLRRCSP